MKVESRSPITGQDIFATAVHAIEAPFGLSEALSHRNAMLVELRKIVRTHCKDPDARRLALALDRELFSVAMHLERLHTLAAVAALGEFDRYVALHANPHFGEYIAENYRRDVEWEMPKVTP